MTKTFTLPDLYFFTNLASCANSSNSADENLCLTTVCLGLFLFLRKLSYGQQNVNKPHYCFTFPKNSKSTQTLLRMFLCLAPLSEQNTRVQSNNTTIDRQTIILLFTFSDWYVIYCIAAEWEYSAAISCGNFNHWIYTYLMGDSVSRPCMHTKLYIDRLSCKLYPPLLTVSFGWGGVLL